MNGWIKIDRGIREHWLWQHPRWMQWWIDLLQLADHDDRKVLLSRHLLYTLKRGQLIASTRYLCERWAYERIDDVDEGGEENKDIQGGKKIKPSVKTVQNFLSILCKEGMIERDTRTLPRHQSLITILHYNLYQNYITEINKKKIDNQIVTQQTAQQTTQQTTQQTEQPIKKIEEYKEYNKEDSTEVESKKTASRFCFQKTTIEKIKLYTEEKGYAVDAEQFYYFYESRCRPRKAGASQRYAGARDGRQRQRRHLVRGIQKNKSAGDDGQKKPKKYPEMPQD